MEDREPQSSDRFQVEPGVSTVVGRDPECHRILPSPVIARRHFTLFSHRGGFSIRGLGAGQGLFVNGQRVQKKQLEPGDRIRVGPFLFTFDGAEFHATDQSGNMGLEAHHVSRNIGKLRILDEVSLTVQPREFVGILGPSGAGKTTLMSCLNGSRPPTAGEVLINGESLSRNYESLKSSLGYVPQDDIIHRELTVRDALLFTARLRLPKDTSSRERRSLVDEVIDAIELGHRASARIRTLSGGERKRVNVAVELVTRPSLLLLDEPTSGLDPATEHKLMKLLKKLTEEGRTVLLTTHVMENVDLFDQVVILNGGRLAFFGPPAEALKAFSIQRMPELYEALEKTPPEERAETYLRSSAFQRYVLDRRSPPPTTHSPPTATPKTSRSPWQSFSQLTVLLHRGIKCVLGDPLNLAALILPGPLIGLLSTVPLDSRDPDDRFKLLFLLTITAIFCGSFNSFRELVKERAIYRRERMVNLRILPYLLSKLLLHAGFLAVECSLLLGSVVLFENVGGDLASHLLILWGAAVAAASLGLLISSLVRTSESAIGLLILVSLPQIIFSGGIAHLTGISIIVGKFTLAFWCFDGLQEVAGDLGRGLGEAGMLLAHTGVTLILTWLSLRILQYRR